MRAMCVVSRHMYVLSGTDLIASDVWGVTTRHGNVLTGVWVPARTDPCLFLLPASKSIQRRAYAVSLCIASLGFVSHPNFIRHFSGRQRLGPSIPTFIGGGENKTLVIE